MDESYVQFCLDEKSKGEAYCTSMARFQSYCEQRRQRESREPVAYMVMEESTDEDEGLLMFLDSGCNSTCHGERWMRRYEELSGYTPEWTTRTVRPMTGIGGAINALGVRKLYVGLETMEGYKVPGEVSSTEIEDSNAPMLLSLQAQEALGLVLDLANMVVTSRMLGCTFKAVRGKNKLIGLRLYPGDFLDDGVTIPVSMMAAEDTKMTYQTKPVPQRGERWSPPRGGYGGSTGSGETPPWRSRSPGKRQQQTGPSSSTSAPSTKTQENTPRPSRAPEVEEYVNVVVEDEDVEQQEVEQVREEGIDAAEEEHDYEEDEILEEDFAEVVQKNQEYVDDELRRRGYLDEDTPPFAEEAQEEDFWEVTETALIRHHFEARVDLFYPNDSLSELPVDISRLGEVRVTNMSFVGTREQERHEDVWRTGEGTPEVTSMSWVGSTEFELKPIEEELKMAKMTWEDGDKKVMNKGQKKRLSQEVESMENEDYAMWSALRRQKIGMPKGWKALMEIFAGCAVLTSVFQSEGYECCQPLDILGGWDVHNAQHRQWAEEMARREKPYLMSYAFVCGPWSPWQRMCEDREKVNEKRRVWMPVFRWMYKMIKEQQHRGGVSLMENPWTSEAWSTSEILKILELNFEYARVDMCTMGLVDRENKLPHKKMTCIASDSKGIIEEMNGKLCKGDHQHQPLEGRNCYGSRCYQAGRYTRKFCGHIVKGVQRDLEDQLCMAFHAESMVEGLVEEREEPTPTFDAIKTEEDVAGGLQKSEKEKEVNQEEDMELLDKDADPEGEKLRKAEWRKLSRVERVGVRRLHHMTSHGTRNQMARMLRYANAAPHVVKGVKYFRCPACDRVEPEKRPQVVRGPDPYAFNEEIGLDIFTVKDVFDKPYQILHILCLGTCFHVGESLGQSQGVPSSRRCLEILLRSWIGWAGQPRFILVDRGTHNRGIFMQAMEQRGCRFKLAALEAPYQLGKVERQGGVLKGMLKRVINAENVSGELEIQMALAECLETKNRQGTVGGFSPSQWVIGKNPRSFAWQDEAEDDFQVISDRDPMSSFNRRAGFRESAKLAWAHEDSHRRVRAAVLRKGGSLEEVFRPGDMVSFMRRQKTGGWIGPARVLACEGKNLWLLHAGIPILVASNRVRGANAEEHLEVELLNKHRLPRKRPFLDPGAVEQDHRLRAEGQVPYVDMREGGVVGGVPEPVGGDDSPKKARTEEMAGFPRIIVEPELARLESQAPAAGGNEDPQLPQQLPDQHSRPDVAVEEPASVVDTTTVTDAEIDAILGPPIPEEPSAGREGRARGREGRASRSQKPSGGDVVERERSRSPPGGEKDRDLALKAISVALSQEFLCFMAKRKSKPDNNEIIYAREDDAMRKRLDESRAKEWSNWLKYQAIRFPSEDEVSKLLKEGYQAVPMRWVDVDKNAKLRIPGGPEVPEKLKSRLVIRGDLEKENFRTDCPTASHTAIHILLAYAAAKDLELHSGDISAAFLQGAPIERVLLLKTPKDGIPTEKDGFIEAYTYLIALMSVYGSKDAPRGFWLELRQELVTHGLTEIDPAFYVLIDEGETCGLLCSHVDDLLWVGNHKMDEAMERVQTRFTFGSKEDGSFRFCGRRIDSTPEEFKVTSPESLGKVKPIYINDGRRRGAMEEATQEEQGQLRAVLGKCWLGGEALSPRTMLPMLGASREASKAEGGRFGPGEPTFGFSPKDPKSGNLISEEDLHLRVEYSALRYRREPWSRGWSDRRRWRMWASLTGWSLSAFR